MVVVLYSWQYQLSVAGNKGLGRFSGESQNSFCSPCPQFSIEEFAKAGLFQVHPLYSLPTSAPVEPNLDLLEGILSVLGPLWPLVGQVPKVGPKSAQG